MALKNVFFKGKGKSTVGIAKEILGQAFKDAGSPFEPTDDDILEVLRNMDESHKSLLFSMSNIVKQDIYSSIKKDIDSGNEEEKVVDAECEQLENLEYFDNAISSDSESFPAANSVSVNDASRQIENLDYRYNQNYPSMTKEQLKLLNFQITEYQRLMQHKHNIIASEENSLQVTFHTFSRDSEFEINAVVNNSLQLSEVLCRNDDMSVTRRDLLTIWNGPDKWINDVIVNFQLKTIEERGKWDVGLCEVICMSTFFPLQLKNLGYCGLPKWMIDKDFSTVDMIFVPVNVENNHWSLVVVNTKTFVLKLYDSLVRIEGIAGYMELLQMFQLFMSTWFMEKKNLPTTWKITIALDIPQQTNSDDCGIFLLMYADYLQRDKPMDFKPEDTAAYRFKLIQEMLSCSSSGNFPTNSSFLFDSQSSLSSIFDEIINDKPTPLEQSTPKKSDTHSTSSKMLRPYYVSTSRNVVRGNEKEAKSPDTAAHSEISWTSSDGMVTISEPPSLSAKMHQHPREITTTNILQNHQPNNLSATIENVVSGRKKGGKLSMAAAKNKESCSKSDETNSESIFDRIVNDKPTPLEQSTPKKSDTHSTSSKMLRPYYVSTSRNVVRGNEKEAKSPDTAAHSEISWTSSDGMVTISEPPSLSAKMHQHPREITTTNILQNHQPNNLSATIENVVSGRKKGGKLSMAAAKNKESCSKSDETNSESHKPLTKKKSVVKLENYVKGFENAVRDIQKDVKPSVAAAQHKISPTMFSKGLRKKKMIPILPHDEDTIKKALDAIEKGSSIVSTALDYGIPVNVLRIKHLNFSRKIVEENSQYKISISKAISDIAKGNSVKEVVARSGFSATTLLDERALMRENKEKQTYKKETIQKAAEEVNNGESITNACLKYNIPRQTLSNWVRAMKQEDDELENRPLKKQINNNYQIMSTSSKLTNKDDLIEERLKNAVTEIENGKIPSVAAVDNNVTIKALWRELKRQCMIIPRQKYSEELLTKALSAIRDGGTIRGVSLDYGIPFYALKEKAYMAKLDI